ncbi:universal stress protein [Massilia yuzhufengensis]|uniref:Nucleotide-binding universal stress protein, UspA family n=1 Tax=Massilia yuzhufengensis TaxID=1164594 RepID=A0A1I1QQJ3_9BURK|nr:universal stress protein [Massilia yuzhufengensis]SFD22108.1 Nucleotide-binding universal stress protein, UspA family [Massilia yuzhufengensis]
MQRIQRILLAIQPAQPGVVALRASLLGPALDIDAFDVLAVKRASTGMFGATTACSHVQVEGGALRALVDGRAQELGALDVPGALDRLWSVQRGSPAEVVARTAALIGADLTLAAAGGAPLARWLRPSANADLVRLCQGAVLLVHAEPRQEYRSVVVATDFSRASMGAARVAAQLAPSARFVFVHACQLPEEVLMREAELPARLIRSHRGNRAAQAHQRLDAFIELFLHALPPGAREVQIGEPGQVVKDCARRHGADLVVVGRGASHPGARLSCSNVMQRLADEAGCDLLVGPGPDGQDSGQRLAA